MMKFVTLSQFLLLCWFISFIGTQSQSPLDSREICNALQAPSECGTEGSAPVPVVSNWGVTHMNCSVMPNTLTINYTLNPGLPNFSVVDVYGRSLLGSIQIQCTDQGKTHQLDVNCSIDANSITFDDEISKINGQFMISNLSEAGISPGSVCSVVDGCYKYQVDGEPPHHVLIPEANCTIPAIDNPNTILPTGTPVTTLRSWTESDTAVPNTELPITNQFFLYVIISVTVVTLLLFLFVPLTILLGCMKHQRMSSIRKTLLVLDVNDMVYDPNSAPPVSIDKPSFSFTRQISIVSTLDLIQSLKSGDRTAPVEDTDLPSDSVSPPYKFAVHNSIKLSGGVHMDSSGNKYIHSELPANFDHQMQGKDSTLQLMMEDEIYQSTTYDNFKVQEFTQNDNWDTAKHNDTFQIMLASNDNQMTTLSPLTADANSMIDLDYPPSVANHISNVTPTLGDVIQLDIPASKEHNEDSSSQSLSYVVLASQNQHQDQHTRCSQPLCSPISMLDDFEDNIAQLGAPDVDECPLSEELPPGPMNTLASGTDGYVHTIQPPQTTIQDDEEASLNSNLTPENFTLAQNDSTTYVDALDLDGLPSTKKPSFSNITVSQDDVSFVWDSDKESVVSPDFAGEVQYSYEVEVQQQQNMLKLPSYYSGSSNAEGNYQIHPLSHDFSNQLPDLSHSQHVLGEGQVSDPSFTSDSSPYVQGVRYTETGSTTFVHT